MHKLLFLLSISSAAYAMDGEDIRILIPATVSMQEQEAPSFIPKECHKQCCGMCCAGVGTVPSSLVASYWVVTTRFPHQRCGDDSLWCDVLASEGGARPLAFMTGFIAPLIMGYAAGLQLGEETFKLDQRLKAKIDGQKQKSE